MLTLWGGSYVWSCVNVLAAPGVPLDFQYKSKGGNLHISADSYALDTKTGNLRVARIKIRDPKGEIIASADWIAADGLQLVGPSSSQRVLVKVRNVYGVIVRRQDGRLDLLDYLPERKGPPSDLPFQVSIDKGRIKFVDFSGGPQWTQMLGAKGIEVSGVGQRWIAKLAATLDGVGNAKLSLENVPNQGLYIGEETAGLELASVFAHFKAMPEARNLDAVRNFRAATLRVKGPARVFVPAGKAPRFEANLTAEGSGVSYLQKYGAANATFKGLVTSTAVSGTLIASSPGIQATFEGSVQTGPPVTLSGKLKAAAGSMSAVPAWLRSVVPQKVATSGPLSFDGWLQVSDKHDLRVSGILKGDRLVAYGEQIDGPQIALDYSSPNIKASVGEGRWQGTPLTGFVTYDGTGKTFTGSLQAGNVNLRQVADRFHLKGVSGVGNLSVLLKGTSAKPEFDVRVDGRGQYKAEGTRAIKVQDLRLVATVNGGVVTLSRATADTDIGTFFATGGMTFGQKDLQVNITAPGVDLFKIDSRLGGTASFAGILSGSASKPQLAGALQVLGLRYDDQTVPILLADIVADKNSIRANDARAIKGASEATGDFAYQFKSGAISGEMMANALQLSDFLGDSVLGSVSVTSMKVSGTLKDPVASGRATAESVLVSGTAIERADGLIGLSGNKLTVTGLSATLFNGALSGSGSYDLGAKTGSAELTAKGLALKKFLPADKAPVRLDGTLDAKGQLSFDSVGLLNSQFKGTLANVAVNDTFLGSGPWDLKNAETKYVLSAQIGQLDRYVDLQGLSFDIDSKALGGKVVVFNNSEQDIYKTAKPYLPEMSPSVQDMLRRSDAAVDANVDLGGTLSQPDFNLKLFEAKSIDFSGRDGGDLKVALSRMGGKWDIRQVDWTGAPGILKLQQPGVVDENGQLTIDGELDNFDLSYLSLFDPELAGLHGKLSVPFLVTGETHSPRLQATVNQSSVTFVAPDGTKHEFGINLLSSVDVTEAGGAVWDGKFNYLGFPGSFSVNVPIRYPLQIPDGSDIRAFVALDSDLDLNKPESLASHLDPKQTSGTLNGRIDVQGPKDDLKLTGSITAHASKLAIKGVDTTFRNADAALRLGGGKVDISAQANSSAGGSAQANYSFEAPEVSKLLQMIGQGTALELLKQNGSGSALLQDLGIRYPIGDDGLATASVSGKLVLGGTPAEPSISGPLALTSTSIKMPSKPLPEGVTPQFALSPSFNIPITLVGGAKVVTSSAQLMLSGGGLLLGTLAQPNLTGELVVASGSIKLPAARVTLEPGGTVRPRYFVTASGNTVASMDVDLDGRTNVSAVRLGDTVERYDITLGVHGDLLKEGGLVLTASSDPPDLSQDQILALLGQLDAIQGFNPGGPDINRQLRDALSGIAVPYLLDPITSKLASTLGFEYLNVEYNAINGTSLVFARAVGKGLTLQGSRQISEPRPGLRQQFDLRLTYRLPFRTGQLRRVLFSIGVDQDRPWKIAVEYGFRF